MFEYLRISTRFLIDLYSHLPTTTGRQKSQTTRRRIECSPTTFASDPTRWSAQCLCFRVSRLNNNDSDKFGTPRCDVNKKRRSEKCINSNVSIGVLINTDANIGPALLSCGGRVRAKFKFRSKTRSAEAAIASRVLVVPNFFIFIEPSQFSPSLLHIRWNDRRRRFAVAWIRIFPFCRLFLSSRYFQIVKQRKTERQKRRKRFTKYRARCFHEGTFASTRSLSDTRDSLALVA